VVNSAWRASAWRSTATPAAANSRLCGCVWTAGMVSLTWRWNICRRVHCASARLPGCGRVPGSTRTANRVSAWTSMLTAWSCWIVFRRTNRRRNKYRS